MDKHFAISVAPMDGDRFATIFFDISDRKRAEEALRQNEATLSSIFKAAPIGVGLVSNRVLLRVNDRLCEMVGYSVDELVGRSSRILYPDDESFEYVGREKYRLISEHGTGTVETRWRCKDGRVIDILLSSTPLDSRNLSLGVTFTALDITDRKRAEEERARLTAIIESTSDLVSLAGPDGRLFYMNTAGRRLLGWPESEDLAGHVIRDAHPAWAFELVQREGIPEAMKAGTWHGETALLTRDGREVPVSQLIMTHRTSNGELRYLSTIMRDMTERKRAEAALSESRERLAALFRAVTDAVYVHEIDAEGGPGRIIEVNDVACRMLGYTREEMLQFSVVDIDAPESTVDVKAVIERLKAGQDVTFEQIHMAKDGRRIPVEIHVCAFDMKGTPAILSMARDITERKKTEQERERLLKELEAKNKEMESLVYVTSHDLRSPLVNILGFSMEMQRTAEMLTDLLRSPAVPSEVQEAAAHYLQDHIPTALGFIRSSGQKMDRLIEGLLRLSRTGRAVLNPRPLDMNTLLENAVASMSYQTQQASAHITIEPLPDCVADEDQINQAFSNLLDNALKYRDPQRRSKSGSSAVSRETERSTASRTQASASPANNSHKSGSSSVDWTGPVLSLEKGWGSHW